MSNRIHTEKGGTGITILCVVTITAALDFIAYFLIMYAYSINGMTEPLDPFKSMHDEKLAAARVACTTTVLSMFGWIRPLLRYARCTVLSTFFQAAIGVAVILALYAVFGLIGAVYWGLDVITPSTFFAEWNWLTFLCEVTPGMALSAALLTVGVGRLISAPKSK